MDKHNHSTVYAAIAASTIISIVANYFMIQKPQIDQVGGRANYKLYQAMVNNPKYAENVKQSLESQASMLNGEQPSNNTQPTAEPKATGSLSSDDIAKLTKDTYVKGDESAQILWIEYSDLECPSVRDSMILALSRTSKQNMVINSHLLSSTTLLS